MSTLAPHPAAPPPTAPDPVVPRVRRALRRRLVAAVILVFLLFAVSVLTPLGQLLGDLVLTGRPTDDPDRIAAAKDVLGVVSVASLAVSGLAIAAFAALQGRWWLGGAMLVAIAGAALFTLIGSETITEGWHRAEDVVGAGLVALAWVAGAALAVLRFRGADVPDPDAMRGHLGAGRLLLAAALAVLVLGAYVWGEILTTGDELLSPLDAWTPAAARLYLGALLVTFATASIIVVTLWRAIRPVEIEAVRGAPAADGAAPATSR